MPNLLAMLPPGVAQAAAQGLNANPAMLDAVLGTTDSQVLAGILNSGAADVLIAGLIPLLSSSTAQAIAEGINADAAQPVAQSMIKSLIVNSDPKVIADAVNNNPDFVAGLMGDLNAGVAQAVAAGMNANPATARTVSRYLNADTGRRIAEAVSANTAIIEPLVANLNAEVGLAIAEGLNANATDLSTQLMANLDPALGVEIAAGLESNAQLITNVLSNLDGNTGEQVALGLNDNSDSDPNPANTFLAAMLGATGPNTAKAISDALNGVAPYTNNILYHVVIGLNPDAAAAVAAGLNNNPGLVEHLLRNLDGTVTADQMNNNQVFMENLVANLNGASTAAALRKALDPGDPDTAGGGQNFIRTLVNNLNPDILSGALNANPQLTEDLMDAASVNGLGAVMGQAMVDADGSFLVELLTYLDAPTMRDAMLQSLTYHDADLPISGHNLFECLYLVARARMLGLIVIPTYIKFFDYESPPAP